MRCYTDIQTMWFEVKQFKTLMQCNTKYMSSFNTCFQYFQYFCNTFQYFQDIYCTFFVLSQYWENKGQNWKKKKTRFTTLQAPATIYLWFSIVFSHWNAYNQDPKKPWSHFLFKMWFQDLSKHCRKSWITNY